MKLINIVEASIDFDMERMTFSYLWIDTIYTTTINNSDLYDITLNDSKDWSVLLKKDIAFCFAVIQILTNPFD
jgi:hypothetical protein